MLGVTLWYVQTQHLTSFAWVLWVDGTLFLAGLHLVGWVVSLEVCSLQNGTGREQAQQQHVNPHGEGPRVYSLV